MSLVKNWDYWDKIFDDLDRLHYRYWYHCTPSTWCEQKHAYRRTVNKDGEFEVEIELPGVDPKTVNLKWNDKEVYVEIDGKKHLSFAHDGDKEFSDQEYKWGVMKFKFKIKEEKSDDEVVKF